MREGEYLPLALSFLGTQWQLGLSWFSPDRSASRTGPLAARNTVVLIFAASSPLQSTMCCFIAGMRRANTSASIFASNLVTAACAEA